MSKILLATPCQDQVAAGYALDVAKLVGYSIVHGLELIIMQNRGTIIPEQRQMLAKQAVELGVEAVLWIDSDMRFPKDGLLRLLAHNVPIVGANYSTRRPPYLPTSHHREHGQCFTNPDADGLVDVSHAGMGFLLTRTAVFQAMPAPWFTLGYTRSDDGFVGEDVYFCRKAKEAGFSTFIDQAVSREVRHVGEMEFTNEHTCVTRDAMLAQSAPRVSNVPKAAPIALVRA